MAFQNQKNLTLHICVFVNVDWFVLSHFTNYLTQIIVKGHTCTVLTSDTGKLGELNMIGVNVVKVDIHRGYSDLFSEIYSVINIFKLLRKIKPDVLELITIKPVIYGGFCSKLLGIKRIVYYMSGLGVAFTGTSLTERVKARAVTLVYKLLMRSDNAKVIVENKDDFEQFRCSVKVQMNNLCIVTGVGVDLSKFQCPRDTNSINIKIAMVSRILHDKGIMEFFEAAKSLQTKFNNVEFVLAGSIDPTNPTSFTQPEIKMLKKNGVIKLVGYIEDIATFLKDVDIFVLPSYREGFPRAIMEAAASGIPVITTDVIGCRSAVINHKTGIVVPVRDHESLMNAMIRLIESPKLRSEFGLNARTYAEQAFDVNLLTQSHINVWESHFKCPS